MADPREALGLGYARTTTLAFTAALPHIAAEVDSNDVCEHQNANCLRMMSERDALRAEVERLREDYQAACEARMTFHDELDEAQRQVADLRAALTELDGVMHHHADRADGAEWVLSRARADLRAQYIRNGVCLLCGGGVLDSGEHIDPERHTAEVERILAGFDVTPREKSNE